MKPEHEAPYPQHPIQWTLKHDVITSSMAAIELILDDERALLVETVAGGLPISLSQGTAESEDDDTSKAKPTEGTTKPRWDGDRRKLWVADNLIKQYQKTAENQVKVLAAFEEEGWPATIYDPLSPNGTIAPKRRLGNTVAALNDNHITPGLIRFRCDGSGSVVIWEFEKQG